MAGKKENPWLESIRRLVDTAREQRAPLSKEVAEWLEKGAHANVVRALAQDATLTPAELRAPGLRLVDEDANDGWVRGATARTVLGRLAGLDAGPEVSPKRAVLLLAAVVRSVDLMAHDVSLGGDFPRGGPLPPHDQLMPEEAAEKLVLGAPRGLVRRHPVEDDDAAEAPPPKKRRAADQAEMRGPADDRPLPALAELLQEQEEAEEGDDDDADDSAAEANLSADLHMRPYRWRAAHARCRTPEQRRMLAACVVDPLLAALPPQTILGVEDHQSQGDQRQAWQLTARQAAAGIRAALEGADAPGVPLCVHLWEVVSAAAAAATGGGAWRDAARFLRHRSRDVPEDRAAASLSEKEARLFRALRETRTAAQKAIKAAATAAETKQKVFTRDKQRHAHSRS